MPNLSAAAVIQSRSQLHLVGGTTAATMTADPWPSWNTAYVTTGTTGTTITATSADVWTAWNVTYSTSVGTSAATTSTFTAWTAWNNSLVLRAPNRSAEQVTADRIACEERRVRQEEAWAVTRAAESLARQKAEELLTGHLSQKQVSDLRAKGWFEVKVFSKDGSVKTYQVSRGRAGNVFLVDSAGRRLQKYCIHPIAAVPDADTMLAQKLLLESDEELFLRTANMTRLAA